MIKGYVLGEQWFATKDDVKRKIHDILFSYPLGQRTNIEDTAILLDLLNHHPRSADKIGCGIAAFETRRNPTFPTQRCFYLIRIDGSEEDFSYLKCITPPTAQQMFRSICRRLVASDVELLKHRYFTEHKRSDGKIQCSITGEWVMYEDSHVDHTPPDTFESLVRTFISLNKTDVKHVQLRNTDKFVGQMFADEDIANQWVDFHKEHARLRVVSAYANLHIIPQRVREQKQSA